MERREFFMISEKIGKTSYESAPRASIYYAMFLLISFLGWVLEEAFFFLRGRGIVDRGFLSFPICIVYGLGMMATYFAFGLPMHMRLFSFRLSYPEARRKKLLQTVLYIVLSGAICTFCELLVGVFMHGSFGLLMWDYRDIPWNIGPYICMPFALVWGVLAFFFMRYLFLPLLKRLAVMRKNTLFALLLPLTVFLLFDISINSTYSFFHRAHMALW